MPGDDAWPRLVGPIEDFDLLCGKEPGRKGARCCAFFLDKPESARTRPTTLALTEKPCWVNVSAISYILPAVSKRVRMISTSISLVRFDGVCGPVRLGK